jgi:hypothetical protein
LGEEGREAGSVVVQPDVVAQEEPAGDRCLAGVEGLRGHPHLLVPAAREAAVLGGRVAVDQPVIGVGAAGCRVVEPEVVVADTHRAVRQNVD